jgi:hypothetical protein
MAHWRPERGAHSLPGYVSDTPWLCTSCPRSAQSPSSTGCNHLRSKPSRCPHQTVKFDSRNTHTYGWSRLVHARLTNRSLNAFALSAARAPAIFLCPLPTGCRPRAGPQCSSQSVFSDLPTRLAEALTTSSAASAASAAAWRHCGAVSACPLGLAARPASHGVSNAKTDSGNVISGRSSGPRVSRNDGQR